MAGAKIFWLNRQSVETPMSFAFYCSFVCGRFSREHPKTRVFLRSVASQKKKRNTLWYPVFSWLGRSDSNTRMTESESVALPLGDAPICGKSFPFTCVILSKFSLFCKRFYTLFGIFFVFRQKKSFLLFFPSLDSFMIKQKGVFLCF